MGVRHDRTQRDREATSFGDRISATSWPRLTQLLKHNRAASGDHPRTDHGPPKPQRLLEVWRCRGAFSHRADEANETHRLLRSTSDAGESYDNAVAKISCGTANP